MWSGMESAGVPFLMVGCLFFLMVDREWWVILGGANFVLDYFF